MPSTFQMVFIPQKSNGANLVVHQECLVVELPTMSGLASHCHERLTNTKRGEGIGREWRKIEKNGNEVL